MSRSAWRYALLSTLLLLTAASPPAVAAQRGSRPVAVRVWEGQEIIPTYELGPEDVNPHFFELEGTLIYPYTKQDRFTIRRTDRSYRVMYLENEYLRVMCLPEIGGRIQSVYDKITGQEMFYRNRVIRPGHIALRGAWVSGGIEWNRGPQGHTVTSFSPVDVLPVMHPDGSASLLIGETEMNFRTAWQVTLTLRPGRRYLEEQIRLSNPTDGFHPYYFWNNTAFPDTDGTRFIYPMRLGTDHDGKKFFAWPVHEGRDLSWLRNYLQPTSVFGYRVPFDFFGAYDVARDFGIVQYANHHQLPGKKAWTWGRSDDGVVAQSVLTDNDGPYIEVQSGPLLTQADFAMLAPGQEISWQEWWYPVNGLGNGFEYATRDVAVQRIDHPDSVELRFATTGSFPAAELEIESIDGRMIRRSIDLSPARTETASIEIGRAATDQEQLQLRIALRSAEGESLLEYSSPLEIPTPQRPAPAEPREPTTPQSRYLLGYAADLRSDRMTAREHYAAALDLDPDHLPSLKALSVLDLEAGRAAAARDRLRRALELDDSDGYAWYLLAASALQLSDPEAALIAGYETAKRAGTTALGYSVISRALARQGDYRGAVEASAAGLSAGGADWTRLFELALLTTYGTGDRDTAAALARRSTNAGTLRLVPHAILSLESSSSLRRFVDTARGWLGEPEFAFLELALSFADVGLVRDASNLLELVTASVPESERRPLPMYYVAYYQNRLGNDEAAGRWLRQAAATTADAVFPSRPETLAVLEYAVENQPEDGRAHLYLGDLLAGLGRLDEALVHWRAAARLDATLSEPRRNLAMYEWRIRDDLEAATSLFEQALRVRPTDQTLVRDLGTLLRDQGRIQEALVLLEPMLQETDRRADITLLLVRCYTDAHRYDDAIALLAATTFTNREGDTGTRRAFTSAHVERGIERLDSGDAAAALADFETALTYPANLKTGRPHRPREARLQYWRGRALQALGRNADAAAAWRECAAGAELDPEQRESIAACHGLLGPGELE